MYNCQAFVVSVYKSYHIDIKVEINKNISKDLTYNNSNEK